MEGFSTYENIKVNKVNKNVAKELNNQLLLSDMVERDSFTPQDIENAYNEELKCLLKLEDLHSILNSLLELETNLEKLDDGRALHIEKRFYDFHNCLSPLLLRALKDSLDADESAERSLQSIKEAIRICVEEELYR